MTKLCFVSAFLLMVLASAVFAQPNDTLVGTWRLLSAVDKTEAGQVHENPFGQNPVGFLTYTAEGRVMAIITYGGRKQLSVNDRVSAPTEERGEAFATMFAYAGHYKIEGDRVTHHVEAASVQNWVNTDLVRTVKLDGNRL